MFSDYQVVRAVANDGMLKVEYNCTHTFTGQICPNVISMPFTKDANDVCTFKCTEEFLQDLCTILNKSI